MKVSELLRRIEPVHRVGDEVDRQLNLSGASSDTRHLDAGDLFIALPGVKTQGVDYLGAAFEAGSPLALVPDDAPVPPALQGRCIAVAGIRRKAALASAALAGEPTRRLVTFGVTGTNGKTSSCHILRHILRCCGHEVVLLTTVAQEFGDWHLETPNTTPDAPLLQKLLARAASEGATAAVIEVSAHGIALDRVLGCRFDSLLFTNLTPDHLDFFGDSEAYYAHKARLFTDPEYHKDGCSAVIGTGDDFGVRLLRECRLPHLGFGWGSSRDDNYVSAAGLSVGKHGIGGRVTVQGHAFTVDLPLTSSFNCLNIAGVTAQAALAGLDRDGIARALVTPFNVPGRLTEVPAAGRPFRVIVDYAHTGSAMISLLTGLRRDCSNRLIVVFGAGGDRDLARRRDLPAAVIEHADVGVITLDNPRSEAPQSIINTMQGHWLELAGTHASPATLHVEPDRAEAIAWALAQARDGDIVVLAGKGHETTQIFADRVEWHNDLAVAQRILAAGEAQRAS